MITPLATISAVRVGGNTSSLAAHVASVSASLSPYPASFDDNPYRYAFSLASLMCLSMFGASLCGWMLRDLWRDRFSHYPTNDIFAFRGMMALIGFAMCLRALPEVMFLTCFGEVTGETMGAILAAKRIADICTFPVAFAWMLIFIHLYPKICFGFQAFRTGSLVFSDPLGTWTRLGKPAAIFALIVVASITVAWGKWALGHHG